jgi:hypothetical protein
MKTKRYNFAFDEKIDSLLREIEKETGLKLTTIVEKAIILYSEQKKNENKSITIS